MLVAVMGTALSIGAGPQATAQSFTARDVATTAGLGGVYTTMGESPIFDFDLDGLLDILPSTHGGEWSLRRQGPPGFFSPIFPGTFPRYDRHGCVAADFGSLTDAMLPDGRPDVYCAIGACEGICGSPYPNELYIQRSDGTFEKVPGAWGADDPHGRGRGAIAPDWDNDGRADLVVVNEASDRFDSSNRVFRNEGGRFVEVRIPLTHEIGTLGALAVRNTAGYLDIYLDTTQGLLVYKNSGGTFANGTRRFGGATIWDADSADLNGDGFPDLVVVRKEKIEVYLNDGRDGFPGANFSYSLSDGRDAALCKMDGDALPDIYVVQGKNDRYQDVLLINEGVGTSFRKLDIPQTTQGDGDIGTCFPNWLGSGRDAIFVTNGKWGARGPYQLITLSQ